MRPSYLVAPLVKVLRMATKEVVVLTCDLCGAEGDGVETHSLVVDGKAVDIELCARQWTALEKRLLPALEAGRRPKRKRA